MMVIIVEIIILKTKPDSVKLLAIVSSTGRSKTGAVLQNNFNVYSRSDLKPKR